MRHDWIGSFGVSMRLPFVSVLTLCLAACAATPLRAPAAQDTGMVNVPLPLGETYSGGAAVYRVMPVYPPAMLASCPAQEDIEVVVRVDTTGKVGAVYGYAIDAFPPPWETFFAAVRPALMQWRFEPLRVGHWAADAEGNAHAVDGAARPFEAMYRFRFVCHAGATSVSAAVERPAAPR